LAGDTVIWLALRSDGHKIGITKRRMKMKKHRIKTDDLYEKIED